MPRIRSIHPDACDSEKLAVLSDSAERTLWRLITHTDDDGRGEDRPKLLAAKLYPLVDDKTDDDIDRDLDEIAQSGLLVRYEVDGRRYYAIPTFGDWQSPRHPRPSKYPPPPAVTAERRNGTAERRHAPAGEGEGVGSGSGVGEVNPLSPSAPSDDGFDRFWEQYPRGQAGKPGGDGSKKKAHAAWKRMSKADRDKAMFAVANYAAYLRLPDTPNTAHASTWLNQERWEQWETPAQPKARDGPQPRRHAVVGSEDWDRQRAEQEALERRLLGDTA